MTSRKVIPGPVIPPRGSVVKTAVPVSAEYTEAVKVLSPETMAKACSLMVLSDDNDQDGYQQLLEMYGQCRKALEVIKREAPAEAPPPAMLHQPTTLSSRALAANRAQAKPLGKPTTTMSIPAGRRIARMPAKGLQLPQKRGLMPTVGQQQDGSAAAAASGANNKKARTDRAHSPTSSEGSAPPPSALNFLAKLNKDKSRKTKPAPKKEKAPSPPPPSEPPSKPTRTQPSRSTRNK